MSILSNFWDFITEWSTWKIVVVFVYALYVFIRAFAYADYTKEVDYTTKKRIGLWCAYKRGVFGYSKKVRVYHIFIILIDIPAVIFGFFIPVIKRMFTFEIYTFKDERKEEESDK